MAQQSRGFLLLMNSDFLLPHTSQLDNSIILFFETSGFWLSYTLATISKYNHIISISFVPRSYTLVLSCRPSLSLCRTLLPFPIDLSRSISLNWTSFALMLSFGLNQFCSSLIISLTSSWLMSESISALDIMCSILFNLFLVSKAIFLCFYV